MTINNKEVEAMNDYKKALENMRKNAKERYSKMSKYQLKKELNSTKYLHIVEIDELRKALKGE